MKRSLLLILVLSICLSLCACVNNDGYTTDPTEAATPTQTKPEPLADFNILGEWIIADDGLAVITFNEDGTCVKEGEQAVKYKVEEDIAVLTICYSTPKSYSIEKVGEYYRLTGEHFLLRESEAVDILKIAEKQKQYVQAVDIINDLPVVDDFSVEAFSEASIINAAEAYEILLSLGDYKDAEILLTNFVPIGILQKSENEKVVSMILNKNGDVIYKFYSWGTEVYNIQYNENGQMLNIERWDTSNVYPKDYFTYSYDVDGNLVEEIYSGYTLENSVSLAYVKYYSNFMYNDNGRLTQKTSTKEWENSETETAAYTYTYNSQGQLIVEQIVTDYLPTSSLPQISETYTYEYDDAGNMVAYAHTENRLYAGGDEYSSEYYYTCHIACWYKHPKK